MGSGQPGPLRARGWRLGQQRWTENDTPVLCIAANEGSARSLTALLMGGADMLLADKDGETALHWAARKGYTACIGQLEAGAPLEAKGVSVFRELNNVLRL